MIQPLRAPRNLSDAKTKRTFDIALSHCLDLDLNGERPGIASDGNFNSYLIGRS